jgi:protein-tyrosine phosphatase
MSTIATSETNRQLVLFLCTANYYRSRIAEMLFNRQAERVGLRWQATSRGITVDLSPPKSENLSPHAVTVLEGRGIDVGKATRPPQQACSHDFETANLIVALDEYEHRQLVRERFIQWADRVEYWHVEDLDRKSTDAAMKEIEEEIERLITRLSSHERESNM